MKRSGETDWSSYFSSASTRPGYHLLMSCGNAVVHVGLDGRTDVLKDETIDEPNFVAEMFGCLFWMPDQRNPRVFKDGIFVRELEHKFENFTSKGVGCSKKYLYYTEKPGKKLIRVDEHLKEEVIPGTEGTSDFVVLKDERLFWITKRWVAHCGDKSLDLVEDSGSPILIYLFGSRNILVSLETRRFCISMIKLTDHCSFILMADNTSYSINYHCQFG